MRRPRLCRLVCVALLFAGCAGSVAAQVCEESDVWVETANGTVELQRAGETAWTRAAEKDFICDGDSIRTLQRSSAVVRFLSDATFSMYSDSFATIEGADAGPRWIDVFLGIFRFHVRRSDLIRVHTRFGNAGIEGTEFAVRVGDSLVLPVYEGQVNLETDGGMLEIAAQRQGVVEPGRPGRVEAQPVNLPPESRGLVYFLPLVDSALPDPDADVSENDATGYALRAASRLRVESVADAESDIERALAIDPGNALSLALRAEIQTSRNQFDDAMATANAAIDSAPNDGVGYMALWYAQSARLESSAAAETIEAGVAADPGNALAWTLLAESRLIQGNDDGALAAVEEAERLNPDLARTRIVHGYFALRDSRLGQARDYFNEAIELDSSAPDAHVGLGIVFTRQGDPESGLDEFDSAAIHDIANSQVRGYLAKSFSQQDRFDDAGRQLGLAKAADPQDPTAYMYGASISAAQNRPVEAIRTIGEGLRLNGGNFVARSSYGLDPDLAMNQLSLAGAYRETNFENIALQAALYSMELYPLNAGTHRVAADLLSLESRGQLARVSENFQAGMRQTDGQTPIQAQLQQRDTGLLSFAGPSELALTPSRDFFGADGLSYRVSAVRGAKNTMGEDVSIAGLYEKLGFNVSAYRASTDGLRANNDLDQKVLSASIQYRPSSDWSLYGELGQARLDRGEYRILFDPANFSETVRTREDTDTVRLALRHTTDTGGEWLAVLSLLSTYNPFSISPESYGHWDSRTQKLDLQRNFTHGRWRSTLGTSYFAAQGTNYLRFRYPDPPIVIEQYSPFDIKLGKVYAYTYLDVTDKLLLTLAGSFNSFSNGSITSDDFLPKLALRWKIRDNTSLRISVFEAIQGPNVSDVTIVPSLEPTHVGGFNRLYAGTDGERVTSRGIGFDHSFGSRLYVGADALARDLTWPDFEVDAMGNLVPALRARDERITSAYVYWAARDDLTLSAHILHEDFDRYETFNPYGYDRLRTTRIPVSVDYFRGRHWSGGVTATHVDQKGRFFADNSPASAFFDGKDSFWTVDVSVQYRMAEQKGKIQLSVKNLFDKDFRFQDTDPINPTILPERFPYLRFTRDF